MKRNLHPVAELDIVDMSPNDGKPFPKGNCTTRSMSFCLQSVLSYRDIEFMQYQIASRMRFSSSCLTRYRFNSTSVWSQIMFSYGYVWLKLPFFVRRDKLARALSVVDYPIISHSSRHVAVVYRGKVVDSWDSRFGRCDRLLVKVGDEQRIIDLF